MWEARQLALLPLGVGPREAHKRDGHRGISSNLAQAQGGLREIHHLRVLLGHGHELASRPRLRQLGDGHLADR